MSDKKKKKEISPIKSDKVETPLKKFIRFRTLAFFSVPYFVNESILSYLENSVCC